MGMLDGAPTVSPLRLINHGEDVWSKPTEDTAEEVADETATTMEYGYV